MNVPEDHPRFESLRIRERLVEGLDSGVVAEHGLLAHGRGEAFDYIMGERTQKAAEPSIRAAAAQLLMARHPVISVNGNAAALVPRDISQLASLVPAVVEVNLFHRTRSREEKIARLLMRYGIRSVRGVGPTASGRLPGVSSSRRKVDPSGIGGSDVVLVPLEDGDRVSALRDQGKIVVAVDLNPLSRTARTASITIVDNIVRAIPSLIAQVRSFKRFPREKLVRVVESFDNKHNLDNATQEIIRYLRGWMGK